MDTDTYYSISDDIKSYQMHAAERLATIIGHKIMGEEPPEYVKFGKTAVVDEDTVAKETTEEIVKHPTTENQTKLPLTSETEQDEEESKTFDLSGMWKGFHTITDKNGETEKFEFELELSHANDNTFLGESSISSPLHLTINNGKIVFDNIIQFDMTIDGKDLSKIQVDAEVKDWGVEGSFELEGNRENFIIHRNDSSSSIDSENPQSLRHPTRHNFQKTIRIAR